MSPIPRLLDFKVKLGRRLRFLSWLKRKHEPRSPSPSILKDSGSTHDELYSLSEKEITFDTTGVDIHVWRKILAYCEVIDIIHLCMTCRTLVNAVEDYTVWRSALLRIALEKRLSHLAFRIKSLSRATLRRKAILAAQMDSISRDPHFRPFPHRTTRVSLQVTNVWSISFLPGGEWLVLLCRSRSRGNRDGVMVCQTDDPSFQRYSHVLLPDGQMWSSMRVFTSDSGDSLLLLRSDRPQATKLGVYQVHLSGQTPRLEMVWTIQAPAVDSCAAQGNCIAYGWINRSDGERRHFVKVLQLTPSYRGVARHITIELECMVSKWPHSYGLRLTDSQIIVITANTELIAAYKVPPLRDAEVSLRKPIRVASFWRFTCTHMRPRFVHLVPSLPAVDTPSVIISYRNRHLFVTPGFDVDPPERHPSYFLTYTFPRGLKRPLILGPHRAFWDLGRGRVGTRTLPAPLQPRFSEGGDWNMSGINTPGADLSDEVRPVAYAEDNDSEGRVMMAAWDEESGKLALLPETDKGSIDSIQALIVSLIP